MQRIGKGFASACALFVGVGCAGACGGIVRGSDSDAGPWSVAVDGGTVLAADAGTTASCPPGGPAGASPELLGPPPGGTGDLWRGLDPGAGEGESFILPRAGVIDQVVVQIFDPGGVTPCRTRIYRWCDGQRVLVATTDTPASAFPVYAESMLQQDLSTTTIFIDPPVPVAAGERVDAVFSALGGNGANLVSVITMSDITPNARAVFPDGAPGIPDYKSDNWDYHAQILLR